jgi:D-alanyl-D-alanine carboxypeptidase/D-alanyl-D-alanine-endopeptidase (penicillin-binding protein 4)
MNRHRMPCVCAALFGVLLAGGPARAGDDLAAKVDALVTAPEYKHARWGLLVVDTQTGQTVYARNPDTLFSPASVTKLFSCSAAWVDLGPGHKFETPVYRRGELDDGRLRGDLILVASGDLTLGGRTDPSGRLAFRDHDHIYAGWLSTKAALTDTDPLSGLRELARQVKAAGVRRVDGDVLVDDRLFARARGSGSGPDVLSPVLVNDNLVDLTVTPAARAGEFARVETRPATDYIQFDARVETVSDGKPRVEVERVAPCRYTVRGRVPAGGKPVVRIAPVEDPAAFARALFIECLRREGVDVKASPFRAPAAELPERDGYGRLTRVALFTSPPLSEAVKVTLKVSHNLYASTLPLLLAAKQGKRTLADGMRRQGRVIAELGADVDAVSFEGGAGGGNADRATPRATVGLLRAMAKRPDSAAFRAALPVLGVDGTLVDAAGADSPVRGKVQAKTGTYGDADLMNDRTLLRSKALAGYLTTAGGRTLAFAFFVNDVSLPRGVEPDREGKALGRLCEIVYRNAP